MLYITKLSRFSNETEILFETVLKQQIQNVGFVFHCGHDEGASLCHQWVCRYDWMLHGLLALASPVATMALRRWFQ